MFGWLQGRILNTVVQRTIFQLRAEVEVKLNRLPLSYFDRQPRGEVLSRVTNDIDNVGQSLQQTMSQLLTSLLTVVGVLVMMLVISPLLALIALIAIPLSAVVTAVIAKRSQKMFIAQWRHTGALNGQIEEAFTGHSLVTVFGRRREVEKSFEDKNAELFQASFGAQFVSGIIMPAMMFIGNLTYVAVAVVGGLRVASGSLSLGDVQAFIQYSRQFTQPLTQLASMANVLQSGVASAERVFELLDAQEQSLDSPDAPAQRTATGRVDLRARGVPLRPGEPADRRPVVGRRAGPDGRHRRSDRRRQDNPGEPDHAVLRAGRRPDHARRHRHRRDAPGRPALADRHGAAGHLAVRRHHPRQHRLRPAGRDRGARSSTPPAPPSSTGSCTPARRLRHGDRRGGSNVSAGEKQLITIARAFLAEPALLILDEATSSVDTRTEVLVQHAMAALRSDRTSFVIAHRLSTIRDADLILVMEAGQIVEQGTHEELLEAAGAYFRLYQAQFTAAIEEEADLELSR